MSGRATDYGLRAAGCGALILAACGAESPERSLAYVIDDIDAAELGVAHSGGPEPLGIEVLGSSRGAEIVVTFAAGMAVEDAQGTLVLEVGGRAWGELPATFHACNAEHEGQALLVQSVSLMQCPNEFYFGYAGHHRCQYDGGVSVEVLAVQLASCPGAVFGKPVR